MGSISGEFSGESSFVTSLLTTVTSSIVSSLFSALIAAEFIDDVRSMYLREKINFQLIIDWFKYH